ncbi:MAG: alpha-ketoglutarate-dependent dioxygenase AlkB [Pseudomonadota bacterium]|nr:alpha-ketoglutarate-dependent dioxygenase AlkB [Pseudomonadota bacterium]
MNQQYLSQSCLWPCDAPVPVVGDVEGGVVYHPGVLPPAQAQHWLHALQAQLAWRLQARRMYERVVPVPRLVASVALDDPARPGLLDEALAAVRQVAPAPYTRVGLNLYRDGRDSVAMHGDRVQELAPGWPIAILSLGAARDMLVRPRGGGPAQRVLLAPGSVLVMSHASQHTHLHGIPKTTQTVGPRMSLAFRVRRPAPAHPEA